MPLSKAERFLALGLDSQLAETLAANSWTLGKLRKASREKFAALGLDDETIAKIKRPPIPQPTLFQVLHKAKRVCCVCRTPGLPIVVHHIVEWHISQDHSETNLAVVCPNDHVAAHTTSRMSQNLTPEMIRKHKAEWEEQVRIADAKAVVGLSKVNGANWDYINLVRIFRLVDDLRIDLHSMPRYSELKGMRLITELGDINHIQFPRAGDRPSLYLCGLAEGRYLYQYTCSILTEIIERLGLIDISAANSPADVQALIADGRLIFVQAPFYFRNETKNKQTGPGQLRTGYTKIASVKIEFTFDAWESTSMSAHATRLTGHTVESVVGLVSGHRFSPEANSVQISCLGIGSMFNRIHWGGWYKGATDLTLEDPSIELRPGEDIGDFEENDEIDV